MRNKNEMPTRAKQRLTNEQAFRKGYEDAATGAECWFIDAQIRRHWRRGFRLGMKGLRVKLPAIGTK